MINKLKKQQKIGYLQRKMVYDVTEKTYVTTEMTSDVLIIQ